MKQIQRDSKYIIKRILIGVGIALILANLKQCHVYADELNSFCSSDSGIITTCPSSSYNYDHVIPFPNLNINFVPKKTNSFTFIQTSFYNEQKDIYHFHNFSNCAGSNPTFTPLKMGYVYYNSTGYVFSVWRGDYPNTSRWLPTPTDYFLVEKTSSSYTWLINELGNSDYSESVLTIDNKLYSIIELDTMFPYLSSNLVNTSDWVLYHQDNGGYTPLEVVYINQDYIESSFELDPVNPFFNKIDISNNQGVYFVPKNYNNIQIETINNVNYIDFNFYYKGSIKYGYFPINNLNDMVIISERTSSQMEYFDSFIPLSDSPDFTGYNYYSYIIFNNIEFTSSIWYNDQLFDYYIIDNFETYSQTICYIDRTNTQACPLIDFSSLVNNWWLEGFNNNSDDFVGEQEKPTSKLSTLFDTLKLPFTWLKSITNFECSTISLPIPFLNSTIQLNCLSTIFKRVLGDSFYNILYFVISGLYAYRIILLNIDSATDVLDPQDDKLEVIDL